MDKKKILIIDDEIGITKMLKLTLERSGRYEVQCENTGARAVPAVKSFGPDLVLLDVNLPDAQGGEISANFQSDPALKKIPIIFLTGIISREEMQAGTTIGGRPTMSKPIDMERLIECIEKYLPS